MKKHIRIIALLLVLVLVSSMVITTALAATSKTVKGSGASFTVVTESIPWYKIFTKPQLTIKNIGSKTATIIIQDENYRIVKQVTALEPNKSFTFKLSKNSTYYVGCSVHPNVGGSIKLDITSKYLEIK